ncbi:GNVR domain-containing protein [Sphingomonas sp. IW22]|uniref:GNVR domain-containing protein n=1 Tax=Sphingomonas sp. IW22 TaxID=3242489 RepID=UPI003521ACBA
MNVWDYVEALRARWRMIALATLVVLAIVGIWTWASPRTYNASATLLFDLQQADPVSSNSGGGAQTKSAALLGTQADIIRSVFVAQRVVGNMGLDRNPELVERYQKSGSQLPIREWIGRRITSPSALEILPTRNTSVLAVNYKSEDPELAARMATAFAEAYVQTQLQLRIDPARVYSQWFESQIGEARTRLEQAQARLTRFQQQHGLVGAGRFDIEQAQLSELTQQLTTAQAEAAQAGAKAGSNVGGSADAQQSAVVQGLDGQIAGKSAELQQLRQTLGPNHPLIVSANAELAELRARRAQAVGTAVSAIQTASAAAGAREARLRSLVQGQRERVLRLSGVQDQMAVLQRDVDTARNAYDAVTTRLNEVRLQSEIPLSNVSLLDRAVPPALPSSPNVALRVLLGLLAGLFVGVVTALFLEWRNPRVRTVGGLVSLTGAPVLADLNRGPRLLALPASGAAS